jgi:ketosteroid isomerase-like protein
MLVDHKTDVDEEMSYIADDAVLVPPNMPAITGVRAIREALNAMVQTEVESLGDRSRGPDTIVVAASGDVAYDVGRYVVVNRGPEGPVKQKGRYITVYKKVDGQWKFAGQAWNDIARA